MGRFYLFLSIAILFYSESHLKGCYGIVNEPAVNNPKASTGKEILSQNIGKSVPTVCLGCICEAASECNQTTGCVGDTCGLFKVTWPYWADAGKPTIPLDDPDEPQAWVRCVTDPYCAAATVQNYLTKFEQDCNKDGKIDCRDYAAIHHVGGYNCNARAWDKLFENRFFECLTRTQQLN